jgi:hypothetical protein
MLLFSPLETKSQEFCFPAFDGDVISEKYFPIRRKTTNRYNEKYLQGGVGNTELRVIRPGLKQPETTLFLPLTV